MQIVKSPNDQRNYRHIILPNKLEAVLISDPETKFGAASLTVNIGHYYDPTDYLGLAHFLEHMLFMGTEKYPDENHYGKFLNNHGGSSNAFTAEEITTYFFDVDVNYLDEVLDIFGQFFISPLLKKESVDREINAVDSEHSKNHNSDAWRFNRMIRLISNEDHPYSKFSTGNLETLKKSNIRDELIKFYKKYYSANLMKLSVISNKSLDEIESIVTNIFSKVENKNVNKIKYNNKPFNLSNVRESSKCFKLVKMVPIAEEQMLHLYFQFPNLGIYNKLKPLDYVLNLICHKSKGSIYYNLKEKGLINNLYCDIDEDESTTILHIIFDLSAKGFKYIPAIKNIFFSYINILEKKGFQKWFYKELKTMGDLNFKFLDKINPFDYVVNISCDMVSMPIKDVLTNRYLFSDNFKGVEKLVLDIFKYLKKEKCIIIISSKYYKDTVLKKEKFYGIKYKLKNKPDSLGKEFLNLSIHSNLKLPKKNIFIPKNTSLIDGDYYKFPKKLETDNKLLDIWYKKDNKFNKPEIILKAKIITNEINTSLRFYVISILYSMLLEYKLRSFSYYASLADSFININVN
mgnify:CR=1 FL=1